MADKEGRTEQATPRRRTKAREKGQVVFSREILSVAVLLASGATLYLAIDHSGERLLELVRSFLGSLDRASSGGPEGWAYSSVRTAVTLFAPVALAGSAGALASGLSQTKGLFTLQPLTPSLERLNPLPRLGRLLGSKQTLLALLQATVKVAVIVGFTWQLFVQEMQSLMQLTSAPPLQMLRHLGGALARLGLRVVAVLALFAALDYLLSRRRLEEQLKMTKQEVKEEHREHEGDPEVRRRQRQRAREILRRTLAAVKRADVVLVNPTHYAVALRYEAASMPAPIVVAKGHDELAARIREVARGAQVPVLHNPPLARALYAEVRVGRPVPARLYAAVAEVLAFVYRLRGRAA